MAINHLLKVASSSSGVEAFRGRVEAAALSDRGTPAVVRDPAPRSLFDWRGLFTVLADRSLCSGSAPPHRLRVSGYSVGTPSDPS